MATKKLESQLLTFTFDGKTLVDVECNIEVNDDSQWKEILITSRDLQLVVIQDEENISVKIVHVGGKGDVVKSTEINNASVRGFSVTFGMSGGIRFYLYPRDVYIHQRVSAASGKTKTTLNYYINKSPMISPYYRLTPNEKGEVKREVSPPLSFLLDKNLKLSSEVSFTYNLKGDHFESDRYQVLKLNIRKRKDNFEYIKNTITPKVKDFLMLVSFLHDSKVNFTSWRVECDGFYTWYYKSQGVKANPIEENPAKGLINKQDLEAFINKCLPIYQASEYKRSIDNAIHTLTLDRNNIIELSFLSYFQALESIILTFRRLTNTELIFPNNVFRKLRRTIEKAIDTNTQENQEVVRKLKNKIGELNRVSLKDATDDFHANHEINLNDIWPLFDDKPNGVIGLNTIRNVLIHGDLLPSEKLRSVAIACQHLRVLLIRYVFTLLGWDCNKTKVSNEYLITRNPLFGPETLKEALFDIHSYFITK
ncbi:hypothetical protein [Mixta calida]|uniref:hypothetical protein n=1 Tax=Mixta calida TaxID=665913 RepID=UPI00403AC701